ncbi:hypothetical protein [Mesorhizobium sp. M1023]
MNSVEALALPIVPAVLAMMGVGAPTLATLVWAHLAIRLLHLGIYRHGGSVGHVGPHPFDWMGSAQLTLAPLLEATVRETRRLTP